MVDEEVGILAVEEWPVLAEEDEGGTGMRWGPLGRVELPSRDPLEV
jgi:hypothetical protein